ncbi:hypothetical protein [Gracilimonas amylolytica]|uniref:hypothetical protein n=1 Tax=Gracilimonas amylolytica TaxID=1749045 RepID=UPI000CD9A31A|nr:hypothetical protein [Gracilimonas amylolytica]
MEFKYGVWQGTSTIKGSDGRYLGEDNAIPAFYCETIPTEYHLCKFGDSRDGKQYNMTALHDMMRIWPALMTLIDRYRNYYRQVFDIRYDHLTTADLYIFSKLLVASTAYLIRNHKFEYKHEYVPVEFTSQTKLVAGVFMIGRTMIERGDDHFNDSEPAKANLLYEYADKHHILISPRDKGYACAGSIRKIKELIDVMIRGRESETSSTIQEDVLSTVDETYRSAFDYGLIALQLELTIKYAEAITLEALLSDETQSLSADPKQRISDHLANNYSCEFLDLDSISRHKSKLKLLTGKLEIDLPEPTIRFEKGVSFQDFYFNYLEQIRILAFDLQNRINTLLDIDPLKTLSLKKVNKRLNIVPKDIFNLFIKSR